MRYLNGWFSGNLCDTIGGAVDVPIGWLTTLADGTKAISPVDDWAFYLTEEDKSGGGGGHVRTGGSGGGGSERPASEVEPVLPSETFKTIIQEVETFYSPSGELDRISWKNDSRWKDLQYKRYGYNDAYPASYTRNGKITLMTNGKFLDNWNCVYLCPFYYDGTDYYYSSYVIYLYFDGDVVGEAALCCKLYNTETNDVSDPIDLVNCFSKLCIDIAYDNNRNISFHYADTLLNFNSKDYYSGQQCTGSSFGYTVSTFKSLYPDLYKFVNSTDITSQWNFDSIESVFYNKFTTDTVCDYGYVCSDAYFYPRIGGYTNIDPEKIPANTTVTITGDTIGDYIYTDNTTGDTSTVNEYITNNYTYVTNNPSGDNSGSGSGGSVSGNVNVSGNVSVGGQIDIKSDPIDINVNVNGGGASGTDGFQFDQDVSLNNYYNWMNEQTSGFSSFMSQFFSWLPGDVVIMICAGFGLVVLARFLGR